MINLVAVVPKLKRLTDSGTQAGIARNINIVSLHLADPDLGDPDSPNSQFGLCVTPVRVQEGGLKLIAWRLSEDGSQIHRLADSGNQPEIITGIASTRISFQRVAIAVRTATGHLKVSIWRISDGGDRVELLGEGQDSTIPRITSELGIVTMSAGQVVTITHQASGQLRLDHWGISRDGATVTHKGSSGNTGLLVTEFAAIQQTFGRVITAVRTTQRRLALQTWAVPVENEAIELIAQSPPDSAGDGRQISLGVGSDVVTAVRTLEGRLKLIRWSTALERLGDSRDLGGPASRTTVVELASDRYMTAVRGVSGFLELTSWQVNPNQPVIEKSAAMNPADQERVGEIAIARVGSYAITAVQDASRRLKLIVWKS